jgi:DNA-binding NtrC family response regulator
MLESTILVVSDDKGLTEPLADIVRSVDKLRMIVVNGLEKAYDMTDWSQVALALIHQRRRGPTPDVGRLLQMISATRRPVATLVVSDHYDSEQAISLLKLGVADYLSWPEDASKLSYLIDVLTLRSRNGSPISGVDEYRTPSFKEGAVVKDATEEDVPGTDRLMAQVRKVASQETTILLSGERGSGKSRLAQLIHELSSRKAENFVVVNCGTTAPNLIESEMFGHLKGSMPGFDSDRVGKFAEVGRGTIFLDEIESLPLPVQAKLLRVVEDRQFEPIGGGKPQPLRARIIAASNRSLDEEVAAQRFRSDLYYRLNVIGFQLPPLRERPGAIASLSSKFLSEFVRQHNSEAESIQLEALKALENYNWPGNVRELRNVIERAVTFCQGREIRTSDLPETILKGGSPLIKNTAQLAEAAPNLALTTLAQIKREAEMARITEALEKHSNNRLRAASELGISRMTLYKKLYKYGLMHPSTQPKESVV